MGDRLTVNVPIRAGGRKDAAVIGFVAQANKESGYAYALSLNRPRMAADGCAKTRKRVLDDLPHF